ncbi:MAG: protoglobin domain-containing protein [Sulfurospirillaceae bacterium]|jgi:uncharacterized membrane protein (DUF373 family)|nr:protoglobin domain-containing protein [Sulfurospirillaceae bacterium]MCK9545117.1 protoglobin domain-containing protein [Sulfurospirillaceae bacterium]MDY0238539.1 protoglobin domain-containing protein [Campylobacterales bacterium]
MLKHEKLKKHYRFTKEDEELLSSMQSQMSSLSNSFMDEFYDFIWDFGSTAKFLKNEKIISYHKSKIKAWFENLFSGNYDLQYFNYLYKIGEIHVRIGLPTHYVNAAFNFVRTFIVKQIHQSKYDEKLKYRQIQAVEKIIDMNLDTLTSSYREEELSKFLALSQFERTILGGLKKFNSYVSLFLAASLVVVAFFAIGLFMYDVYLLFFSDIELEQGVLTVLGSLLVLWAAKELIHEEIKHLQGKGFALEAFIMFAIAALIRKVLIYSLSADKINELLIIGLVIVALAVAYWLINMKNKHSPTSE